MGGNQGRVVLAIVATILSMVLPPIAIGEGFDPSLMIRAILVTVVMATIALTAHVVARQVVQQRQALERHDKNLAALLQESEQRQQLLDTVVETVSVGVRVVDPDGGSILVNRRYRAAVARANDDETEAADAGMLQLLAGDRATPIDPDRSPVRRAAAGETISEELYWAGTGKSQRAFSVAARQMSSRNGAFTGSVLSFADVTSLVTALAAKDEFVTTMSHEVRTPLTSIFGYLEMLMDEPGNAGIRDDLAVIARNAERLLVLLDNLMAAGSDGADLKWAEADLGQIIEDAAALVAPDANAAGLDLVMDLRRPVKAAFDPERVSQVLHNLLSNAIKYSPDGGVISINAHRDGQEVVCTFSDRGIGMRPEEVEQAFTKFFRAGHARESSIPGAGLGLPISKSIIERHGGTISLNSHPGKGTTVKFTLPANLADAN
ncbi:cell wall metabolism sensor histidine kinase WalK [Arthrobacter sp. M4]|uniref:sensor histidine kinase n=1 Tax=Arthrobacter sp. M4 TaxID=218160 RepID=UPI001CDD61FB|nr:HAMP domain-containing sensor histidine kinase [Arthrobacter sp. M4]